MPPKKGRGPPKTIPSVNYKLETELHDRNIANELERKRLEREKAVSDIDAKTQKLKEVEEDHKQVIQDRQEVVNDITREFKVQQNDYRNKLESLQNELTDLKKQLEEVQTKIRQKSDKFERQKQQRDEQIQKNITKAELMAQEFRDMLKGTLVKMSDRIEMSRDSDENQPTQGVEAESVEHLAENN